MTNRLRKQLYATMVSMLMLAPSFAVALESQTSPQESPLQAKGLLNKIKNLPSAAQRRIKRVYRSLIGSDEFSPEEVIVTRLVLLVAVIELYHLSTPWFIRMKSYHMRQRLERERKERLERAKEAIERSRKAALERLSTTTSESSQLDCCVCMDEEKQADQIPCKNGHPEKICLECLHKLPNARRYPYKPLCPLCRKPLSSSWPPRI